MGTSTSLAELSSSSLPLSAASSLSLSELPDPWRTFRFVSPKRRPRRHSAWFSLGVPLSSLSQPSPETWNVSRTPEIVVGQSSHPRSRIALQSLEFLSLSIKITTFCRRVNCKRRKLARINSFRHSLLHPVPIVAGASALVSVRNLCGLTQIGRPQRRLPSGAPADGRARSCVDNSERTDSCACEIAFTVARTASRGRFAPRYRQACDVAGTRPSAPHR